MLSPEGAQPSVGRQAVREAAAACLGGAVALGAYVRWVRPRVFSWGATTEEATRPMAGDELCPRPQLNATRGHHRRPIGGHLAVAGAVGLEPGRLYSYDLLDNLGRPSARQILPQFQHLQVGDWVPMGGKTTPYTAYRVARLEPGTLMLWHKPGGSWLWLLEPDGAGQTRLITRLRSRYAWARPTIVTELILMEIGDPFMMRKCLLGIKQRAEQLASERRLQR